MAFYSVGIVETDTGQMKIYVQTEWRSFASLYRPNEGQKLPLLGEPHEFDATPESLEKVLYRYQQVDSAACPDLTDEIVRAYIKAREHNGYKEVLIGSQDVIG